MTGITKMSTALNACFLHVADRVCSRSTLDFSRHIWMRAWNVSEGWTSRKTCFGPTCRSQTTRISGRQVENVDMSSWRNLDCSERLGALYLCTDGFYSTISTVAFQFGSTSEKSAVSSAFVLPRQDMWFDLVARTVPIQRVLGISFKERFVDGEHVWTHCGGASRPSFADPSHHRQAQLDESWALMRSPLDAQKQLNIIKLIPPYPADW